MIFYSNGAVGLRLFLKNGREEQQYTIDLACDGCMEEKLALNGEYNIILLEALD